MVVGTQKTGATELERRGVHVAISAGDAPGREAKAVRSRIFGLTRANLLIVAVVLVFLVPPLADISADQRRPYGYVAPDAFYYFTIAQNWVDFGMPTFDQVHPTNGFHPLWQWLVTLVAALLSACGFPRLTLVPVALVVDSLLLAGAVVLLGLALTNRGRLSPWFSLLPVGVWPLIISPVWWSARDLPGKDRTPLFGTLWNFVNGLESAPLLLIFAAVVWVYVKRPVQTARGALCFGVLLGALSLARLDHAIFALAIGGIPWAGHLLGRRWPEARLGLWTMSTWLVILLLYVGYNRLTVGRFTPVSGGEKSTFPIPSLEGLQGLLAAPHLHPRKQMYGLGRIGSVTFPGLFALFYLPFVVRWRRKRGLLGFCLREGRGRSSEILALTAIATLALSVYDVFFVVPWHIGEWYAPVSIVFVTLVIVQATGALAERWLQHRRSPWWAGASAVLVFSLCAVQLNYFVHLHRLLPWGKDYGTFCIHQARRAIEHYAGAPPRLISRDDGVVAFGTGFPTTSGTRLALDVEAAEAAAAGRFEELLARRGIDHVTAFQYNVATGFRVRERSPRVQAFAESVLMAPPERTYEVEYVDGTFGILRTKD
jgi:hypothetical protein